MSNEIQSNIDVINDYDSVRKSEKISLSMPETMYLQRVGVHNGNFTARIDDTKTKCGGSYCFELYYQISLNEAIKIYFN